MMTRNLQQQRHSVDPAEVVATWLVDGSDLPAQTGRWAAEEWQRAQQAILIHGIAPLLFARLHQTAAWAALDPALQAYLAEQYALNRQRMAAMQADLAEVLHAAAAAGLALMPLKGAILVERFYPEAALRPMADLDLLVRPADLPQLTQVLHALGYQLTETTPRHCAFLRGSGAVVSYSGEHPDNPRGIEVHTLVAEQLGRLQIDLTARLWRGATPGYSAAAPALLPAACDLFAHLLIHTSHNLYFRRMRLIQAYDILLAAAALAPADWQALAAWIANERAGRLLAAPLLLSERMFGPCVPSELRPQFAAAVPARLRQAIDRAPLSRFSVLDRSEISLARRLEWYQPGREWLAMLVRLALPAAQQVQQRYPQLMRWPLLAYTRYYAYLLVWAVRRLSGRARPVARRARL